MTSPPRLRFLIPAVAPLLAFACAIVEPPPSTGSGDELPLDRLHVPEGFSVNLFASTLRQPRFMAWSPEGVLYVTQPTDGEVVALPDRDGDGHADEVKVWVSGLNRVHGIAFHDGYLYLAETGRVIRYPFQEGEIASGEPEVIVDDLPPGGQHWTRTIAFGPDGNLYVATGSSCNVCEDEDPHRAAVTRYSPTGGEGTLFSSGHRNSVGLAFHPLTGELWATNNGRDWLGDDIPPEEINILHEGGFYGWPYAYGDRIPDPEFGAVAPDKVAATIPPTVNLQAHSAPLGLAFYTGNRFPPEYQGDLFVVEHGSWNRSSPVGYQVIQIELEGADRSTPGAVRPFLSGFLGPDGAWGRPVDVAVGPDDGALYISDDRNGTIYRVAY
ncbi:MAG: PQQ-dependent sugar dehydrogenase [Acidobacteriota bacterium]